MVLSAPCRERGPLAGVQWCSTFLLPHSRGALSPSDQTEGDSFRLVSKATELPPCRGRYFIYQAQIFTPTSEVCSLPLPRGNVSCSLWEGKYHGLLCSCLAGGRSSPPFLREPGLGGVAGCSMMQIPERVPGDPATDPTNTADPSRPTTLQTGAGGGGKKGPLLLTAGPPKRLSHSLHINHGKASTLSLGGRKRLSHLSGYMALNSQVQPWLSSCS